MQWLYLSSLFVLLSRGKVQKRSKRLISSKAINIILDSEVFVDHECVQCIPHSFMLGLSMIKDICYSGCHRERQKVFKNSKKSSCLLLELLFNVK